MKRPVLAPRFMLSVLILCYATRGTRLQEEKENQ
jgi:hypothetical protein